MNLKNFADGLAIIRAFYDDQDGYHIGAEHDQIYLYATDVPMDAAAIAKLQEIGWFQDEAENDADGKPIYDPSSSWSVFVEPHPAPTPGAGSARSSQGPSRNGNLQTDARRLEVVQAPPGRLTAQAGDQYQPRFLMVPTSQRGS